MDSTSKHCTRCSEYFPATLEYFGPAKKGRFGLEAVCRPCRREQQRLRRLDNVESARMRERQYYANHPEKFRQANYRWRNKNPERSKAINRKWAAKNKNQNRDRAKQLEYGRRWRREYPAKKAEQNRRWRTLHPEAAIRHNNNRRARKNNLPATLTRSEWQETLRYFDYRCAYCSRRRKLEQEHVIPVSQGGPYTQDNIVPSCRTCNSRKGPRTPEQAGMPIRKPWPIPEIGT